MTRVTNRKFRDIGRLAAIGILGAAAAGCSSTVDQIAQINKPPYLSAIENPTAVAGYRPVSMPMPDPEPPVFSSNSLWRSGARAFFKDQRAKGVGDILTVEVIFSDKAIFDNKTERSRIASGGRDISGAAGNAFLDLIPDDYKTGSAVIDLNGDTATTGEGSVNRKEELRTNLAAVVTQVLPNGNMVIEGRQEVRVNFEMRELIVAGVIRPEDITANNTVDSTKIAEARISYGGRGQITDVQQPPYGQQFLDIILPF
ncbi:flagellar basal body L-ring protein FlgH [Microbaculum sp. FT89]|uniref:flagellar basal body L-ring protein FlgH n=1 Tax=Microbaculum sp. FT89 TaxID=3447298 RepID=UPI003F5384CE